MKASDRMLIREFIVADGYDFPESIGRITRGDKAIDIVWRIIEETKPSKVTISSYANIGFMTRELTIIFRPLVVSEVEAKHSKRKPMHVQLCTCGKDLHIDNISYNIETGHGGKRDNDGFTPLRRYEDG